MGGRARIRHSRRTGEARGSEADGSLTLSTSRWMARLARRPSFLGEQRQPVRSRLDLPPSRLSRRSGDRPLGGVSGPRRPERDTTSRTYHDPARCGISLMMKAIVPMISHSQSRKFNGDTCP